MRKFHVQLSKYVINDIDDLVLGIALTLKAPLAAKKYKEGLISEIKKLSIHGASISVCQNQRIQKMYGYNVRRVNYKKIAIFYVIDQKDIIVKSVKYQFHVQ